MRLIVSNFLRSGNPVLSQLNVYDRIILLALADAMQKDIVCWPGYRKLSKFTGIVSFSTILKSLLKLEALNLIKIERFFKRSSRYTFLVDNMKD
jgi:hypothetical protein